MIRHCMKNTNLVNLLCSNALYKIFKFLLVLRYKPLHLHTEYLNSKSMNKTKQRNSVFTDTETKTFS